LPGQTPVPSILPGSQVASAGKRTKITTMTIMSRKKGMAVRAM
jgi:hypothetical protein